MSTMICDICHRFGIRWEGLSGLSPHTRCPHCGGINCQVPEESNEQEEQALSEDANREMLGDDAAFFEGEDIGAR
jgi:hypothetical protein